MELPIVAVVILASLSIFAAEENNAMYADAMESYSGSKTSNTNVNKTEEAILKFVHQKIDLHTEALEKIREMIEANANLSKKILETLSNNVKLEDAETHGKIKIFHTNRRKIDQEKATGDVDIPLVTMGKNIVTYEKVVKSVLLTDLPKACKEYELEKAVISKRAQKIPKARTRTTYTNILDYLEKK